MNVSDQLSLEQQFKVKVFTNRVRHLSSDELRELIVDLYENSLLQENAFRGMLGEYLGLSQSMTV